jgi:hypothetical protein
MLVDKGFEVSRNGPLALRDVLDAFSPSWKTVELLIRGGLDISASLPGKDCTIRSALMGRRPPQEVAALLSV